MIKITEDHFDDLQHYRYMFELIRDNTQEIIETYKQNSSEIEIGFMLGKLQALASNKHVDMLNTLDEIREYNRVEDKCP